MTFFGKDNEWSIYTVNAEHQKMNHGIGYDDDADTDYVHIVPLCALW